MTTCHRPRENVWPCGLSVVVTGGGRGLGRAFAQELAAAGARLLIVGRDGETLRHAAASMRAQGGDVTWAVADTRDSAALGTAVASFGRIDVLINNAGLPGPLGATWEVDPDEWWRTVEVNLRGTETVIRAIVPSMIAHGHGRLITIVSNAGRHRWPHASAYSVSKAAQIKLMENLAVELKGSGVAALVFDPGLLDIGMTKDHIERGRVDDRWADRILGWTLQRRAAGGFTPVVQATAQLLRLATGAADHLSGQYITSKDVLGNHAEA